MPAISKNIFKIRPVKCRAGRVAMTFVELPRTTVRFTLLLLILTATAVSTFSQGTQSVSGTVKDQSGSAIPGATVTVTETATGSVRTFTTDASGGYAVPTL